MTRSDPRQPRPAEARHRARAGLARCATCAGLALLLASPRAGFAAEIGAWTPVRPAAMTRVNPDTWVVTLSGTLQGIPRYPGASDDAVVGYPGVDIHRLGEPRRFSAPDDDFSALLYDGDAVRLGPTARFVPGRYYGDDRRHLFGFRDTRFAVEPGVFVEVYPSPAVRLRGEIRQGLYGHHGTVGTVGADYVLPFGPWQFSVGPRLNLGDASFARKYFGVAPDEAAANGRVTPFSLSAFRAAGVLGAATYTPDETWAYTAFAGYNRILGQSANSPLVRRPFGSPDQFTLGLKVNYSFTTPAPF